MLNAPHKDQFDPRTKPLREIAFNPFMIQPKPEARATIAARAFRIVRGIARTAARAVDRQRKVWITIDRLRRLDDRTLRDIGVERDQIETVIRDRSVDW